MSPFVGGLLGVALAAAIIVVGRWLVPGQPAVKKDMPLQKEKEIVYLRDESGECSARIAETYGDRLAQRILKRAQEAVKAKGGFEISPEDVQNEVLPAVRELVNELSKPKTAKDKPWKSNWDYNKWPQLDNPHPGQPFHENI